MIPSPLDLTLYRGADFGPIEIECLGVANAPIDLTGWTPKAQVRVAPQREIIFDLNPSAPTPTDGKVFINFLQGATKFLPLGEYVWDLVFVSSAQAVEGPVLAGKFYIKPLVTRV